jgi:hypothetical protein
MYFGQISTPLPQFSTIVSRPAHSSQAVQETISFSTYAEVIVTIFQFKSAYQISEINEDLRQNMAVAISRVLEVAASNVILTIVETYMRRALLQLQKGVLVTVSLKGYYGSTSNFASRITQDNINSKMIAFGLKSAQIIQIVNIPSSEPGMRPGKIKHRINF